MDDTPLNDFLQPDETEPTEAETPEAKAERERDELGRFKAKEDTGDEAEAPAEASATPAQETEQERVPVAALKDERQKRQQLEERLRQYDEYFASLSRDKAPEEAPDQFVDPEGHQAYVIRQAVQAAIREITPQLQQQRTLSRAEMSEMVARTKYPDYDDKIEVFKEAAQRNPLLIQQVQEASDPATYAYNAANNYLEAKQYGTAMPTREQIKAELRDELIAELGIRPNIPSSLADARSVGSRSGPAFNPDYSLSEVLFKP